MHTLPSGYTTKQMQNVFIIHSHYCASQFLRKFALDVAQMLGPWATPWVQFTLHRIGISWQKDKGI